MNGKDFDVELEKCRELKELLYENAEAYCKGVNRLQPISDYRKFLYSSEIATLDKKIHENNYDSEAIKAAKLLFNANSKDLEEQLDNKRTRYENKIEHEMNKYKMELAQKKVLTKVGD